VISLLIAGKRREEGCVAFLAIGDLHLGSLVDKPMDIFGEAWRGHVERLAANWRRVVTDDDVVLVPGDISWAMKLAEAAPDLQWLAALPGRKVLLRGNHDYWWEAIGKVRAALPARMIALQNDHVVLDGVVIGGARGWNLPTADGAGDNDARIYARERQRLAMSFEKAPPDLPRIAMLHFPPALNGADDPGFTDILERLGVRVCVYGHLHGASDHRLGLQGEQRGVRYVLCAADAIDFTPVRLALE
jgi:predicted phosphohydrolase